MNSDNLRILNALKAIADKLGADDKSNVSKNEVGKIAEELERIAMIKDLKPEPSGGGGGSGGGEAEIVPRFSYDETTQTHSCDMSFDDVADAISAGRCHWAVSDQEGWLQIKSYDPEDLDWGITFGPSISFGWGGTSYRWINRVTFTLNQDGSVEATSEQIDTRPGT